jgi:adenylosuccinate synthase
VLDVCRDRQPSPVESPAKATAGRLFVSERVHLILPYHPLVDSLRKAAAADGARLGTTRRGISPCYGTRRPGAGRGSATCVT